MSFTEEKTVMLPYCNTGAQNTELVGLRACVDWLQVTFKNVEDYTEVIELIGLVPSDFTYFPTGNFGYKSHARFGHIEVYFDGQPNMGVHLKISGQGCREYEEYNVFDWSTLLALMFNWDINISRLDVAIDDFEGYFKLDQVLSKVKRGHVTSKFKEARQHQRYSLSDGSTSGLTVYFGDPSSRIQVRMYDKKLQLESKGQVVKVDFWNRTEIQLRNERAENLAIVLAHEHLTTGQAVQGILSNYLNFRIPSKTDSKNKSRWKKCDWWLKFLDAVQPLSLTQVAPDATVQRSKDWIEKQVSPTLAMLYEAFDQDEKMLMTFVKEGLPRLKKKHENMISKFKADKKMRKELEELKEAEMKKMLSKSQKDNESTTPNVKIEEDTLNEIKEHLERYYNN